MTLLLSDGGAIPVFSEDGEAIDLLPGNQYILHYQPIEDLVKTGSAILI